MSEYVPTPAPQFLTAAYWPAHDRVEAECRAQGIDQIDLEAEAFFAGLRAVESAVRADMQPREVEVTETTVACETCGVRFSNPAGGVVVVEHLAGLSHRIRVVAALGGGDR